MEYLNIIKSCKQHITKNELVMIEFDNRFKENYFKIIHNIYYLTLRKMHNTFIDEYINKKLEINNSKDILDILAYLFDKNIKQIRYNLIKKEMKSFHFSKYLFIQF